MTGIAIGAACVAGIAFGPVALPSVAILVLVLRFSGRVSTAWATAMFVVTLAGVLRAVPAPEIQSRPWFDEATAVRGVVDSGPLSTDRGQRFNLAVTEYRIGSEWHTEDAEICVYASDLPGLRRGDRVHHTVTISPLEDLPEGVANAFAARGCSAVATAWRTTLLDTGTGFRHALDGIRRTMAGVLQASAPGNAGSLMAGLVTGDDGALSDEARDAFVATGTTHITAISGSNVAIVVVAAIALGGKLGFHRRLFWQVVTAGGVWFYALLVGLEPPAFRAAIVATGVVAAGGLGRRPDLVTLTTLAAALQLLWRPSDFWTLSFRLSFVAALALALVLRGIEPGSLLRTAGSMVLGTAAAQVATAPVLIASFGRVSLMSLPANLLIAPLVAIAFPLSLLASLGGLIAEPIGEALAVPASVASGLILSIVRAMDGGEWTRLRVSPRVPLSNVILVLGSVTAIATGSLDCRRAIRRGWRWCQHGRMRIVLLGVLVGLGFVIGLIAGAAR